MDWAETHRFLNLDVEWTAADSAGRIGVFLTNGRGPIPAQHPVLDDEERLNAVAPALASLPPVRQGQAGCLDDGTTRLDEYRWAARGLWVFDWDWDRARYQLVARPDVEADGVGPLPDWLTAVRFAGRFPEALGDYLSTP